MSQYPSPYSPQQPPYYGGPAHGGYGAPQQMPPSPEELLKPARRAGVLMIVVGVLFVLFGLCMGFMSYAINQQEFMSSPQYAEMQQQFQQLEAQTGTSIQTILMVAGIVPLVVGALFGGLGFFVRGGGLVSVVLAIALTVGLELFFGITILMGVIQAATSNPAAMAGICVYVLPFALLVLLLVWLIQAARNASRLTVARQQYQAQVMQYQQYQQAYLQQMQQNLPAGGMGYYNPPASPQGSPPPAPPSSPAPPAAGAPPERKDPPDGASPQG